MYLKKMMFTLISSLLVFISIPANKLRATFDLIPSSLGTPTGYTHFQV